MGRKRLLALLVFLCMAIPVLGASITINPAGKAKGGGVLVKFDVTEKNLIGVGWLVGVKVDGDAIDPKDCTPESKLGGAAGEVFIPNIPAGTHKVYLKVKLQDNSTVEKEADVTFPTECCVFLLCLGTFGLLGFLRWHSISTRGRTS